MTTKNSTQIRLHDAPEILRWCILELARVWLDQDKTEPQVAQHFLDQVSYNLVHDWDTTRPSYAKIVTACLDKVGSGALTLDEILAVADQRLDHYVSYLPFSDDFQQNVIAVIEGSDTRPVHIVEAMRWSFVVFSLSAPALFLDEDWSKKKDDLRDLVLAIGEDPSVSLVGRIRECSVSGMVLQGGQDVPDFVDAYVQWLLRELGPPSQAEHTPSAEEDDS